MLLGFRGKKESGNLGDLGTQIAAFLILAYLNHWPVTEITPIFNLAGQCSSQYPLHPFPKVISYATNLFRFALLILLSDKPFL